jgi:RNA polymerase subunit RPABC4/transcription elongation factor Spt4
MKKKECPSCALDVESKLKVCPYCGYEFPAEYRISIIVAIILLIVIVMYMII